MVEAVLGKELCLSSCMLDFSEPINALLVELLAFMKVNLLMFLGVLIVFLFKEV